MTRTALALLVAGVLCLVVGVGLLTSWPWASVLLGVLLLVAGVGSLSAPEKPADGKAARR